MGVLTLYIYIYILVLTSVPKHRKLFMSGQKCVYPAWIQTSLSHKEGSFKPISSLQQLLIVLAVLYSVFCESRSGVLSEKKVQSLNNLFNCYVENVLALPVAQDADKEN